MTVNGPFSNVGRPAQGPATFNDLATRLPTAARARLNRSERTNRSLLPTHSGAQNTQFRAASIAIGIVLMAAQLGGSAGVPPSRLCHFAGCH